MAKTTKRGYKDGRPKRDNEEDSDDNASRSNDEDYNDMLGDNDDDEEDNNEDELHCIHIKLCLVEKNVTWRN